MFISTSIVSVGLLLALVPYVPVGSSASQYRLASAQGQTIALDQSTDRPSFYRGSGR